MKFKNIYGNWREFINESKEPAAAAYKPSPNDPILS